MKRFARPIMLRMHPREKYPYMLLHDITVQTGITGYQYDSEWLSIESGGRLTIRNGYSWDGASGAIDTLDFMLASLVHDAFYQLMRMGVIPTWERVEVDVLLVEIARANGMTFFRSHYVYWAVRLFGGQFAKPENKSQS